MIECIKTDFVKLSPSFAPKSEFDGKSAVSKRTIKITDAMRANFSPRFCSALISPRSPKFNAPSKLNLPSLGSTILSVTNEPTITIKNVEAIIKYQFAVAKTT